MNKAHPGERLIRLIALCLCGAVYFAVLGLIFQGLEKRNNQSAPVVSSVTLNFVQMELQAPVTPLPEPEMLPDPEIQPEPDEADVAIEEIVEESEPEPQPEPPPEPDAPVAQVTQEAASPIVAVQAANVQAWLVEQLETEKYYPAAAERFGITGSFDLSIRVGENGTILSADVLGEGGHRILRQALGKMLAKIIGRNYGAPVGELLPFEFEFTFE
ncbi:MAG: energy transducer TonB [Kiritimatiellaeota bacterium]|nr:energy transducer TonB [Kiritimatiellota bacterium]